MTTPAGQQGGATMGGTVQNTVPGPVQYNIANLTEPQVQTGATTAPAATMAQNAANARANQAALGTFFGTGGSYAPQYEVDYSQIGAVANAQSGENQVRTGGANNPT